MAFSSILRNKSSTFLRAFTSTAQLIRKTQPGHRAVISSAVNRYEDSFVPRFHFSSVAAKNKPSSDENLLRVIESEITCAQETDDYGTVSFISVFYFIYLYIFSPSTDYLFVVVIVIDVVVVNY
jgi:complement component 1 Q subcomponent-binding protein